MSDRPLLTPRLRGAKIDLALSATLLEGDIQISTREGEWSERVAFAQLLDENDAGDLARLFDLLLSGEVSARDLLSAIDALGLESPSQR